MKSREQFLKWVREQGTTLSMSKVYDFLCEASEPVTDEEIEKAAENNFPECDGIIGRNLPGQIGFKAGARWAQSQNARAHIEKLWPTSKEFWDKTREYDSDMERDYVLQEMHDWLREKLGAK